MLTRRQARLLGLTSGEEGGNGSPSYPLAPPGNAADDVAFTGVDFPTSLGTGARSSPHLTLHLGAANPSVLTVRGSAGSVDHANAFFAPSASALTLTTIHTTTTSTLSTASGLGGRGRLGSRQVEAMRLGAQAVVDSWAAASTTAGPSIRFAGPHDGAWPTSLSCGVESPAPAHTSSGNGSAGVPGIGSAKANNTSSSGNSSGSSSSRPARLSAAQLRVRWRAVTRNCSSLVVPARLAAPPSQGGAGGSAGRSSPPTPLGGGERRSHTLVLSHAAATTARPASPPPNEMIAWADGARDGTSTSGSNGTDGTSNGTHDDRTHAGPEVASRRSLTYFKLPFSADAPLPVPAIASSPLSSSSASGETWTARSCRTPITALALRQQKVAARTQRQRRLSHEVYYQVYVKAHEARMRLLFGLGDGGEGHMPGSAAPAGADMGGDASGEATAAAEAAYLQTLNASTEEEGRVLRVIASIDAALRRQLAAAYRHPSQQLLAPSQEETSAAAPASASSSASFSRPTAERSAPEAFAVRRPAILEAAIADATDCVQAFTHRLLPYQQEGVRWLLRLNVLEHMNGILADDMGLGKTAQTVVYLSCFKDLIEDVVQRPLDVLRRRHARLCQRALGLTAGAASSTATSALSPLSASASASPRRVQGKDAAAALLPPWLMWCEGGLAATTAGEDAEDNQVGEKETGIAGASVADGEGASPELTAARACGNSIRLVKQVKHWLWQLDSGLVDAAASSRTPRQPAPQHLAGHKRRLDSDGESGEEEGADADDVNDVGASGQGTGVWAAPSSVPAALTAHATAPAPAVEGHAGASQAPVVVVVRRRRGRPPKHLSAMMAAASATATPIEVGSAGLAHMVAAHTTVPAFSPAVNLQLETGQRTFRPVLIIAPLSTLPHWAGEFARFSGRGAGKAERFTVYVLNGSRVEREARMASFLQHVAQQAAAPQSPSGADAETGVPSPTPVLVIPHDMLTKPLSGGLRQVRRVDWHVVVIDEAQRIKSARSTLFKKVCELRSLSRLVLTGTPVQNNTTELFSLLRFLAPQSFASSDLFEQLDSALLAASRSSALEDRELHILLCRRVHRLLMPFILRREKSILKTSLPPMRDYAVLCPLLPFQRAQLAEVGAKAQAGALSGNPHVQYRKILLHPYTTQSFFYVNEEVVRTSGKLLVLDFMMRFLQRTGHKFLVFCGWTLVLDVVETLCGMRDIPYVRLDGRTPVEQREANIRGFNRPMAGVDDEGGARQEGGHTEAESEASARPRRTSRRLGVSSSASSSAAAVSTPSAAASGASAISNSAKPNSPDADGGAGDEEEDAAPAAPAPCCFLISKVAGGVGLNLQAADTVFLLDVDYNPQRDAQALSRVYRVGQTKEVRVFRLVIDHPIERDVVAIHEAKDNLGRAIVQAGRYDLHSSVQEREAALQQVFRAGTLSQLSQQWAAAATTNTAGPDAGVMGENGTAADAAADEEGKTGDEGDDERWRTSGQGGGGLCAGAGAHEGEGEAEAEEQDEARVPSPSPAFPGLSSAAASSVFPTTPMPSGRRVGTEAGDGSDVPAPAQTPIDLHRVFISSIGVVPLLSSALKQPGTPEDTEEGNGAALQQREREREQEHAHQHQQQPVLPSTSSSSLYRSATNTVSGELGAVGEQENSQQQQQQHRGGAGGATAGLAPQRRQRRHISFKLEDDDSTHGEKGTARTETANGGSVLRRTSPPPTATDDDIKPPTPSPPRELQPAEHLLAMRDRLEEVLLRQDGERRVLDQMYRAVHASLRSQAAAM